MDARQEERSNPFGMDEECTNCPELCETREQVVHGYGDVGADFVVLGDAPTEGADATGVPFTGEDRIVLDNLYRVGLLADPGSDEPDLDNVYLTYVTRCRHPDRPATDEEVRNCEGYRSSELRMINPEIIVPVGQRALQALAFQYTTMSEEELDVAEMHATTVRGRGFELVPMLAPADQSDGDADEWVEHFAELMGTDYRQTKGRQGDLESGRGSANGSDLP